MFSPIYLRFLAAPLLAGLLVVSGPLSAKECYPYLLEYIKFGRQNNPIEVLKLQVFLREFEGFSEVPLSGVYDAVTFGAVKEFQERYGRDILRPWGITGFTGYVFITTRLAINNIYCGRDTANDLDLRNFYPRPLLPRDEGAGEEKGGAAMTTASMPEAAAAPGFSNWLANLSGGWLVALIFFIIVIAFLGIYWRPLRQRLRGRPLVYRQKRPAGAVEAEKPEEEPEEEVLIEEPEEELVREQPPLGRG